MTARSIPSSALSAQSAIPCTDPVCNHARYHFSGTETVQVSSAICLRMRYAMPGPDIAHGETRK